MSDGPHKTLPMRQAWKRVAERGDKVAFEAEEVSNAMVRALEADARDEMAGGFLQAMLDCFRSRESSLFPTESTDDLERLASAAGMGIGRDILDFACLLASRGETGRVAAESAVKLALVNRASRSTRQVEEHYLGKSTQPRAVRVRERLEQAVALGQEKISSLVKRLLRLETEAHAPPPLRKRGIDDGVKL